MSAARLWHGSQLLACYVAAAVGLFALRWVLVRGVYETAIRDQRVVHVSGLWPEEFAALITVVSAGIVLVVLAWLTTAWFLGRKDRAALRENTVLIHRRILM